MVERSFNDGSQKITTIEAEFTVLPDETRPSITPTDDQKSAKRAQKKRQKQIGYAQSLMDRNRNKVQKVEGLIAEEGEPRVNPHGKPRHETALRKAKRDSGYAQAKLEALYGHPIKAPVAALAVEPVAAIETLAAPTLSAPEQAIANIAALSTTTADIDKLVAVLAETQIKLNAAGRHDEARYLNGFMDIIIGSTPENIEAALKAATAIPATEDQGQGNDAHSFLTNDHINNAIATLAIRQIINNAETTLALVKGDWDTAVLKRQEAEEANANLDVLVEVAESNKPSTTPEVLPQPPVDAFFNRPNPPISFSLVPPQQESQKDVPLTPPALQEPSVDVLDIKPNEAATVEPISGRFSTLLKNAKTFGKKATTFSTYKSGLKKSTAIAALIAFVVSVGAYTYHMATSKATEEDSKSKTTQGLKPGLNSDAAASFKPKTKPFVYFEYPTEKSKEKIATNNTNSAPQISDVTETNDTVVTPEITVDTTPSVTPTTAPTALEKAEAALAYQLSERIAVLESSEHAGMNQHGAKWKAGKLAAIQKLIEANAPDADIIKAALPLRDMIIESEKNFAKFAKTSEDLDATKAAFDTYEEAASAKVTQEVRPLAPVEKLQQEEQAYKTSLGNVASVSTQIEQSFKAAPASTLTKSEKKRLETFGKALDKAMAIKDPTKREAALEGVFYPLENKVLSLPLFKMRETWLHSGADKQAKAMDSVKLFNGAGQEVTLPGSKGLEVAIYAHKTTKSVFERDLAAFKTMGYDSLEEIYLKNQFDYSASPTVPVSSKQQKNQKATAPQPK